MVSPLCAAGIPLLPATGSGAVVCGQQPSTGGSPTEEALQKTQAEVGVLSGTSRYRVKERFLWRVAEGRVCKQLLPPESTCLLSLR